MSYYFHHQSWSIDTDPTNGMRIPTALVFIFVPLMGALFLMFMPLIGFLLTIQALAMKVRAPFMDLAATVQPGWVAGEAHLTGKRDSGNPSKDAVLDELQEEIDRRRQ